MKAFGIIRMTVLNMCNFILYYLYMLFLRHSDYFIPCVFILLLVFLCIVILNKAFFANKICLTPIFIVFCLFRRKIQHPLIPDFFS